ncbi:hypothetical protein STEG23_016998, partial [Scotinomys teguina]
MQKDIDRDAQTRSLPTFKEVTNQNRNRRWWTCCLGCGSQEEEELPPLVVTCDSVTSYKNKVSSEDLSAIVKQDTSPGNNVGEHDRRFCLTDRSIGESEVLKSPTIYVWCLMCDVTFSNVSFTNIGPFDWKISSQPFTMSKETSAKEPEQRNEKVVRSNEEVHHNTAPKPSCSELKPPRQQRMIIQKPVLFHTEVNEIPEQKTPISEIRPPGQQQPILKQPVQINAEVNEIPEQKTTISEIRPPGQQQPILKQLVQINACKIQVGYFTGSSLIAVIEILEQKTSISEVNPPGQQQPIFNQPLQINAVNDRPKEKSSISEAMTLKQMKSINKSSESVELCEDYPTGGPENIKVSME